MRKYLFNPSWYVFMSLYFGLFLFGLTCAVHVGDEYEGGDRVAEFGANIFEYVLAFPANLIDYLTNKSLQIDNGLVLPILILDSVINCLIITTFLNFFYKQVEKRFGRLALTRR
jgi:hypothetical protein